MVRMYGPQLLIILCVNLRELHERFSCLILPIDHSIDEHSAHYTKRMPIKFNQISFKDLGNTCVYSVHGGLVYTFIRYDRMMTTVRNTLHMIYKHRLREKEKGRERESGEEILVVVFR